MNLWSLTPKYSIEFLIKTVGVDRCIFGSECPGVGAVVDPETGRPMDDLVPIVEKFDFLSDEDKHALFEGNARKVFNLNK